MPVKFFLVFFFVIQVWGKGQRQWAAYSIQCFRVRLQLLFPSSTGHHSSQCQRRLWKSKQGLTCSHHFHLHYAGCMGSREHGLQVGSHPLAMTLYHERMGGGFWWMCPCLFTLSVINVLQGLHFLTIFEWHCCSPGLQHLLKLLQITLCLVIFISSNPFPHTNFKIIFLKHWCSVITLS